MYNEKSVMNANFNGYADLLSLHSIRDIKVKVDSKILSIMLDGGDINIEKAQVFFVKVSSQTGAIISYPQSVKKGQSERKEPQIRLIGNTAQTESAKNMILAVMDPHKNKMTMKLDISHIDHSHIIGRGGTQIQSIMNSTECHIHFPDCNRTQCDDKSNQVSIASNCFWKAERARQLVRQHLPLTVSFHISLNRSSKANLLDNSVAHIQYIKIRYNVTVTFRYSQTGLNSASMATVFVKGTRACFGDLRDATHCLYNYLNESGIGFNSAIMTITIVIASQHHPFVMGRGNCNVKTINDHTGAVVSFPQMSIDSSQVVHNRKKSLVSIKGRGIESAFMAWLELLGYLPLTLVFDLPPGHQLNNGIIAQMMSSQELSVLIKQKYRTTAKTILIRTQERNSNLLYKARELILQTEKLEKKNSEISDEMDFPNAFQPPGFPMFPQSNPHFKV